MKPHWMKSTRSIAVVIILIGYLVGLFMGIISPEMFSQVGMLIIGAYFAKRSTREELGE